MNKTDDVWNLMFMFATFRRYKRNFSPRKTTLPRTTPMLRYHKNTTKYYTEFSSGLKWSMEYYQWKPCLLIYLGTIHKHKKADFLNETQDGKTWFVCVGFCFCFCCCCYVNMHTHLNPNDCTPINFTNNTKQILNKSHFPRQIRRENK